MTFEKNDDISKDDTVPRDELITDDKPSASEQVEGITDAGKASEPTATHATLNSETAGGEIAGFFSAIGRGIRWMFPESLTWVIIWLAASFTVYVGHIALMNHMENLMDNLDPMLDQALPQFLINLNFILLFIQVILIVLPLILLTIHRGVVRGIEAHTAEGKIPPKSWVRYILAVLIGLVQSSFAFVLAITFYVLTTSFFGITFEEIRSFDIFWLEFRDFAGILMLPLFVPLLIACVLTALFASWRIGVAKNVKEVGETIRPGRAAMASMLIFVLSFTLLLYPATHLWNIQQERLAAEQELLMDDMDEWLDFDEDWIDFDEDFTFGETMLEEMGLDGFEIEGIEFDGFGDFEDFDDFDWDEGEEVVIE